LKLIESIPTLKAVPFRRDKFLSLMAMTWPPNGVKISILPWRDWDQFWALALEDGGVEDEQFSFIRSFPLGLKVLNRKEFETWLALCAKFPVIQTRNGNYLGRYDLHVWLGSLQLAFNPDLELLIIKRHSLLGRMFNPVLRTPWHR